MADLLVHVWCEDRGHESVVAALAKAVAQDVGASLLIETKNGEGGAARAISEFKTWQRAVQKGSLGGVPDILIIVVDANGDGHVARRASLGQIVDTSFFPHVVFGCPDPHVEAWLLLDHGAFAAVTGSVPLAPRPRAGEDYKGLFHASVAASGIPVLTGPMELAPDIIAAMDLSRASLADRSLARFLSELRSAIQRLVESAPG